MELAQLKLLIGKDEISDLLEKYSDSLPEDLQIDDFSFNDDSLSINGVFKDNKITAVIAPAIDQKENRIGLVLRKISLDSSFLSFGLGIIGFFTSKEKFVMGKIGDKIDEGVSVEGNTAYLDTDFLLTKLPLPLNISGDISRFGFTGNGIELVIG